MKQNASKRLILDFQEKFPDRGRQLLLFEFFITFARFEYALKECGFFTINNRGVIQPSWEQFASKIKDVFNPDISEDVKKSVNYLNIHPPSIQVQLPDEIRFEPRQKDILDNSPLTTRLVTYVRDVRNNLFHGNKLRGTSETQLNRDFELIEHSLNVLNSWLCLDYDVEQKFHEPF